MAKLSVESVARASRILTWIGIIEQLSRNRMQRALDDLDLPFPQFALLSHCNFHPERPQTVTAIASAMQQPQPGITKTIQKMLARKYFRAAPNPQDARSQLLYLTPKGRETHAKAVAAIVPLFAELFAPWEEKELDELFLKLDKLKVWLDTKGRE